MKCPLGLRPQACGLQSVALRDMAGTGRGRDWRRQPLCSADLVYGRRLWGDGCGWKNRGKVIIDYGSLMIWRKRRDSRYETRDTPGRQAGGRVARRWSLGTALQDDVSEAVVGAEPVFLRLVALLVDGVRLEVQLPIARGVCLNIPLQAIPLAHDQYLRFAGSAPGRVACSRGSPGARRCP